MRKTLAVIASIALLSLVAACGSDDTDSTASSEADSRTVTVFAAASLTKTFTELADRFEQEHEGVEVRLSFAGSSDLAAQILEGAPADVFAAADERTMATVVDGDAAAAAATIFATNMLVVVTPPKNPAGVESLADLASSEVETVLCAPQVPCGAASQTLLEQENLNVTPVSEEQNVTDVLGKITNDVADAGLVYVTDAVGAGDKVFTVDTPEAASVVNNYPIVALKDASDADLAQGFVDFVLGSTGTTVLGEAGFGAP